MDFLSFVVFEAIGMAGIHTWKRQPLLGTQMVWEWLEILFYSVTKHYANCIWRKNKKMRGKLIPDYYSE